MQISARAGQWVNVHGCETAKAPRWKGSEQLVQGSSEPCRGRGCCLEPDPAPGLGSPRRSPAALGACATGAQPCTGALERCLPEGAAWLCHDCTQTHGVGKHTQGGFSGWIRAHGSFWF